MSRLIVSREVSLDATSLVIRLAEQMEAEPDAEYLLLPKDVVRDMVRLRRRVLQDNRRTEG